MTTLTTVPAVEINNLRKTYANGVEAVRDLSFSVKQGQFFALLGPNGAGKSTTIGAMTTLVKPTDGQIQIYGDDLHQDPQHAKAHMGLVPQEYTLSMFETAHQTLFNQGGYYGLPRSVIRKRAEHYLKKLNLWDKRDSVVRSLSGGMKRRLMIVRALLHEPQLLILDEPTAGIDLETRDFLWSFLTDLNQADITLILSTHYLDEAEHLCNHVVILDHGQLLVDQPMVKVKGYLKKELFVLYTQDSLPSDFSCPEFKSVVVDEKILEVELSAGKTMNALLAQLSKQSVVVTSIKNKTNHLENVFRELTMGGIR